VLPRINLHQFRSGDSFDYVSFGRMLSKQLLKPPYICILSGFRDPQDDREFFKLIWQMADQSNRLTGHTDKARKPSFTKIRISPQEARSYGTVTGYSRTNLPLELHTDSSYMAVPHEFVGFQCLTADAEGGVNTYGTIDEIIGALPQDVVRLLEETVYPFGKGLHAVLSKFPTPGIRYYRGQVDRSLEKEGELCSQYSCALAKLDEVLKTIANKNQYKLEVGEALVFNNHKALHGRTGFAEDSQRLLVRLRHKLDFEALASQKVSLTKKLKLWFGNSGKTSFPVVAKPVSVPANVVYESVPPSFGEALLSSDTEIVRQAAKLALAKGRFREAEELNSRLFELVPGEPGPLYNLAAIARYFGDSETSANHLEAAAKLQPLNGRFVDDGRPKILTVRGLQGAKFTLMKTRGRYHTTVQRGHFSLKHLYDGAAFDKVVLSLFDQVPSLSDELSSKPDIILNTVACGDRMVPTLRVVEKVCESFPDVPVINNPAAVIAATRVGNCQRFRGEAGILYPETIQLSYVRGGEQECAAKVTAAKLGFPLILRPAGTHTGVGVSLVKNTDELLRFFYATEEGEQYAIRYHEQADERGLYAKTRVFFIDGKLYPVAALMHNDWNVHSGDRYSVMDKNPWMQDREKAFLADIEGFYGASVVERLYRVCDIMGLDFFGIDFTVTPEGDLFIFEANAAMRHNFDHAGNFPYTRPTLRAVSNAFQRMLLERAGMVDV